MSSSIDRAALALKTKLVTFEDYTPKVDGVDTLKCERVKEERVEVPNSTQQINGSSQQQFIEKEADYGIKDTNLEEDKNIGSKSLSIEKGGLKSEYAKEDKREDSKTLNMKGGKELNHQNTKELKSEYIMNDESINTKTLNMEDVKEFEHQNTKVLKSKKPKKIKHSIYLTEEADRQFTELYTQSLLNKAKKDRSDLICEAINLLYRRGNRDIETDTLKNDSFCL